MDLLHRLEHLLNEHMLDAYIYTRTRTFVLCIHIYRIYIYTHK